MPIEENYILEIDLSNRLQDIIIEIDIIKKNRYKKFTSISLCCQEDVKIPVNKRIEINLGLKCKMMDSSTVQCGNSGYNRYESMGFYIKSVNELACTPLSYYDNLQIIEPDNERELSVILENKNERDYTLKKGNKIAKIFHPELKLFTIEFIKK